MKKQIKTKLNEFLIRRSQYSSIYNYYKNNMTTNVPDELTVAAYSNFWKELAAFDLNFGKINWGSPRSVLRSLNRFLGYEKKRKNI